MKPFAKNRCWMATWVIIAGAVLAGPACDRKETAPHPAPESGPAAKLRAAGKNTSMTILPVWLAGNASAQVAEVLGMLLERSGMSELEVGAAEFHPSDQADPAQTAAALAEFVRAHPPTTDFVLYAEFRGTPGQGVAEVRSMILDRQGAIAWHDSQSPNDKDFRRIGPRDPMACCVLVAERLRPLLGLGNPQRSNGKPGKLTLDWERKTGVPDKAERDAMDERQAAFRNSASSATLVVFPVRAGGESRADQAVQLAHSLTKTGVTRAVAATEGPSLDIQRSMNEQKVLWDMARAFREYVRKNPPDADYALFADYIMSNSAVGAVHVAMCDRAGEWVIVDYQNSHHDDFKAVNPRSTDDCDQLVVRRMERYAR